MAVSSEHRNRIKKELRAAGVTRYGMLKQESRYLPHIIHEGERIGGVVYGHYNQGNSGMLVATNRRVIFLDRKPLFTIADEMTYGVISGVSVGSQSLFSAVNLHTRLGDYKILYANPKCADKFMRYIETRRIEESENGNHTPSPTKKKAEKKPAPPERSKLIEYITPEALAFLRTMEVGTLSTADADGLVYGAVVYYFISGDNHIYILTKSDTKKAHNIFAHHQVALTVYNADTMQTLTILGNAEVESGSETKDFIMKRMARPRVYEGELKMPPVTSLTSGSYFVIRITPTSAKYSDYRKTS